jgi:hypothetical protein
MLINIIGGSVVIGSYIWGFRTTPDASQILWGSVPLRIRLLYTMGMFLAAGGYFAFLNFILLKLKAETTGLFYRYGYGVLNLIFVGILIPSALWMPLSLAYLNHPASIVLWAVRLVLWLVALSSLALLAALMTVQPRQPKWAHVLAIIGSAAFCFQTVLLDAIVWVAFFR